MDSQIIEQAAPFPDNLQQSAARAMIFAVCLEVLGEICNPFAKQGNLNFRGSRIGGVNAILGDYSSFVFLIQTHLYVFNSLCEASNRFSL